MGPGSQAREAHAGSGARHNRRCGKARPAFLLEGSAPWFFICLFSARLSSLFF